MKFIIYM